MRAVAQCMRIFPLAVIGAVCLLLAAQEVLNGASLANKNSFSRECALRDLAAIEWVEEQAEARSMPSALLAEAAFTALRARNACMQGQVAEALALYDSVLVPAPIPAISADAKDRRGAAPTR